MNRDFTKTVRRLSFTRGTTEDIFELFNAAEIVKHKNSELYARLLGVSAGRESSEAERSDLFGNIFHIAFYRTLHERSRAKNSSAIVARQVLRERLKGLTETDTVLLPLQHTNPEQLAAMQAELKTEVAKPSTGQNPILITALTHALIGRSAEAGLSELFRSVSPEVAEKKKGKNIEERRKELRKLLARIEKVFYSGMETRPKKILDAKIALGEKITKTKHKDYVNRYVGKIEGAKIVDFTETERECRTAIVEAESRGVDAQTIQDIKDEAIDRLLVGRLEGILEQRFLDLDVLNSIISLGGYAEALKLLQKIRRVTGISISHGEAQSAISMIRRAAEALNEEEFHESIFADLRRLQTKYSSRFYEFHLTPPTLEAPEIPPDLTEAHLEVFNEVFGAGNLELSVIPSEDQLTPEYLQAMYPETQREEDTARGLKSYNPTWFEGQANTAVVGTFPETATDKEKTWFAAYLRSMKVTSKRLQQSLILTESVRKPTYTDGKQQYTTKEGNPDPLTKLLQEVFGENQNHRFNLTHDQWTTQLIPRLKERIIQNLTSKGLTPSKFEIILTPALISNQQTTLSHPENSQTNTFEWTDDTLLKQDKTDSGHRLLTGRSGYGGAGSVHNDPRGNPWDDRGGRLSVVFPKS